MVGMEPHQSECSANLFERQYLAVIHRPVRWFASTTTDRSVANPMARVSSAFVGLVFMLGLTGCGSSESNSSLDPNPSMIKSTTSEESSLEALSIADRVTAARRSLSTRNWDAAAESAYKILVEDPANNDAMLIAGQAEFGRRNYELAAELAADVDIEWRLAPAAVDLHAQSMADLGRVSEAADILIAGLESYPETNKWRHQAWNLLNRVGRREEASRQAEHLCAHGVASEDELISMLRRTDSYPTTATGESEANRQFFTPLGIARWHFTQQQYREAWEALEPERRDGFSSPASAALNGRLLSELQSLDEFREWHASCDLDAVKGLGDYWAAVGTYLFDQGEQEASTRAFLKAVVLNPTDRLSVQRLSKTLDALGRADDAAQFRQRAIDIAHSERLGSLLERCPANDPQQRLELRNQLMQHMFELERPFESLGWAKYSFPPSAQQRLQAVRQQREQLLRSGVAEELSRDVALIGVDPNEFSLGDSYESLRDAKPRNTIANKPTKVESLAVPRLVNVADQVGLNFQWYQDLEINLDSIPIHESVGGGIAVLDFNLDGWPDIYLAQGSGEPPTDQCTRSNQLMRNEGGTFSDVTGVSGTEDFNYGSGLAAGDINQDGFLDLFVGSLGHNRLLVNNGDGSFRDATDSLGTLDDRFSTSLAIADINGDGLPDLYEAVYIEMEGAFALPKIDEDGRETQPTPLEHYAESDRWYLNEGNGDFKIMEIPRDVARPGTSLGVMVTDFNGSGSNEVFVGNDVRPNHFLIPSEDNALLNAADAKGLANGFSGAANGCMGIASGDFNRDGIIDLHITNFNEESANLYVQEDSGSFTDLAIRYGLDTISLPYVGFGTKAIDFDQNGWLDLVVTNGHIFDMSEYGEGYQMPPQFLVNRGTSFEQIQVDDDSGYWDQLYLGRTMAKLDFDRDNRTDLLINHLDQPLALLRNETESTGRGVQFELVGVQSERDAIGARVVITAGNSRQTEWVTAGDGYFCSDEPVVDFGIGPQDIVDQVQVYWPSGNQQTFRNLEAGSRYLLVEGSPQPFQR